MKNLISEGIYKSRLKEYGLVTFPSGTPALKIIFEIEEGDFVGRTVSKNLFFGESSKKYFAYFVSTLGMDDPSQLEKLANGTAFDKSIYYYISVTVETYKNSTKQGNGIDSVFLSKPAGTIKSDSEALEIINRLKSQGFDKALSNVELQQKDKSNVEEIPNYHEPKKDENIITVDDIPF